MIWKSERPSNIALIKYMGKSDIERNKPSNSSLSWTLDHLKTTVVLEQINGVEDVWEPLPTDFPFPMSEKGKQKYLNHFKRLKDHFSVKGSFILRSGNNFPADCGIASSASSFAALTEVSCLAFSELSQKKIDIYKKAELSALGSGSSCRSFLTDWVMWDGEVIKPIDSDIKNLQHMVVIVGEDTKKISSSQAHKIVPTSALYQGRAERAEHRLNDFVSKMNKECWPELFQLSWEEFWDMHALFETSRPAFGYFLADSFDVLRSARFFWQQEGDGPLVTMDAGPNVHLLWREDQVDLSLKFFQENIAKRWTCLTNIHGIGFHKV